jgi:Predicted dehydrogenases and related proteins
MKKINIAVIGAAGWIGGVHSDCWGRAKSVVKDTEIVLHSAVDISLDNLMKIKNRFGYLNISTNYDEIINNPEIDLIDICCDNNFHKDIAVKAAKSNKYVLCEKPLAVSFDDAKIMVDTVKNIIPPIE